MSGKQLVPTLAALLALAGASAQAAEPAAPQPPPVAPATPAPGEAPSSVTPPAPAFNAGDRVADSQGTALGAIQTLIESPAGPMVVVNIEGKLVSLPQGTLRMQGTTIVSSQTKAQILAAAGAPAG